MILCQTIRRSMKSFIFEKGRFMETKIYIVKTIEGEYATLVEESTNDDLFIAMALLPPGVDIGTRLSYIFPDFEII